MFKKPTTAAAAAPEDHDPHGLPPEYTDPTSRLYVPEHLREHYNYDPIGGMLAIRSDPHAPRTLARRIRREYLAAHPDEWQQVLDREARRLPHNMSDRVKREILADRRPETYQPDVEEGDRLEKQLTTEDYTYGAHLRALEEAEKRHARAQRNAATRAAAAADALCEICGGTFPRDHVNTVRWHSIHGAELHTVAHRGVGGAQFRACGLCAVTLADHLRAEAAATLGPDGRSRAELAAAWREAQP